MLGYIGRPPTASEGLCFRELCTCDGKYGTDAEVALVAVRTDESALPRRADRSDLGQEAYVRRTRSFSLFLSLQSEQLAEADTWTWVHCRDLVPSVFVLFLRLSEEDDELLDKSRDEELVKELVARKKVLSERGIKLTVVLIASRELLGENFLALAPSSFRVHRLLALHKGLSSFVFLPSFDDGNQTTRPSTPAFPKSAVNPPLTLAPLSLFSPPSPLPNCPSSSNPSRTSFTNRRSTTMRSTRSG
jgi:hypothetical protein